MRGLRYVCATARDFFTGELTLRAMSLVYTTILSVVPLIAFSFAVLRGLGFHQKLEPTLIAFLEPAIGHEDALNLTGYLVAMVDNVRGATLASVSFLVLFYTVVSMMQKVESSFNFVWQVKRPRGLKQRLTEYVSVLLIGPALMAFALGAISAAARSAIVRALSDVEPLGEALIRGGRLGPVLAVICVFTFLYVFIPNTKVSFRAALIGGCAGGLLWAVTSALFTSFVATSTTRLAIYSGFAVGVLILIWIYLNWLILLIGSQLSFYVQHPECLRSGHASIRLSTRTTEMLALAIMQQVGRDFVDGRPGRIPEELPADLGMPFAALAPVLDRLEGADLIRAAADGRLMPGRALDRIALTEIVGAVRLAAPQTVVSFGGHAMASVAGLADDLERAIRATLGDRSLRDLVDGTDPGPGI